VAAKPNGKPNGKPRGPEIRIPQAAFKARVQREAAVEVKRRLGITIEEAEALVRAKGEGAAPGASGVAVANEVVDKLTREKNAAEARAKKSETDRLALEAKHKKDVQRLKDKNIEAELRFTAKSAGITDPDYATHLFARAAASGQSTDPDAFFTSLKTSHPFLFVASTAPAAIPPKPTEVPAGTAPPESAQPGEAKPTPAPAGSSTAAENPVDQMNPTEFGKHMRQKYGYTSGMS
jgi:hypothetical protein